VDAVVVGVALRRLYAALRNPGDPFVEVVDEDRHDRVTSVLGLQLDVDRPVLGELPHRLGVVRDRHLQVATALRVLVDDRSCAVGVRPTVVEVCRREVYG
jgi:hypothetical protein